MDFFTSLLLLERLNYFCKCSEKNYWNIQVTQFLNIFYSLWKAYFINSVGKIEIKWNKKQPLLPSFYRGQKKKIKDSIPWPTQWCIDTWHPSCSTGSSLSTSGECRAAPSAGSHLPVLPRLSRHPAPVTDENWARANFALTHTGNPWQVQELDPVYSSFSPELCDLWYCCNETCLSRSPLFGGEKLRLFYTYALTPKPPHSIFQSLQHHFSSIFAPNRWSILSCSVLCHVLFSLLYQ